METSRRSFLGGMFALSACAILPAAAFAGQSLPVIKGDGVHDDSAGFRAAMAGEPFMCEGCVVVRNGGTIHLGKGTYRVGGFLSVTAPRGLVCGSGKRSTTLALT